MEKLENLRNKKYVCVEKGLAHIYTDDDDEKIKELLDANYIPDVNMNYPEKKLVREEIHGQMNYPNLKSYNMQEAKKEEDDLEKRQLINEQRDNVYNKKASRYITGEKKDNITIDVDAAKECAEIHYQFDKNFPNERRYEHTPLSEFPETNEFIEPHRTQLNSKWIIGIKIAIILLIVACVIFVFTKFKKFLFILQFVIDWVGKQGSWSILLFILLFTFTAPLLMSVEIMCIGSGLIFCGVYGKILGLLVAVFCVAVGYLLGMSICFFVSRYLIHDYMYRKLIGYPIYMAFNQEIDVNGLSFVLLIRLSPILPAAMVSYILGVTSLKYKHFALGSISALPSIFLFAYLGALLQDISNFSDMEHQRGSIFILIIGIIIGISAIIYIAVVTKRRLDSLAIINTSLASTTEVE